jgi:hypothetical protein
VYLLRENDIATVLVQEGLDEAPPVVVGEGAVGVVIATGKSRIVEGSPQPAGTLESPLAVIPLRVRERVLGAIVVVSVFESAGLRSTTSSSICSARRRGSRWSRPGSSPTSATRAVCSSISTRCSAAAPPRSPPSPFRHRPRAALHPRALHPPLLHPPVRHPPLPHPLPLPRLP